MRFAPYCRRKNTNRPCATPAYWFVVLAMLVVGTAANCAQARKICVFLSCASNRHVGTSSIGVPLTITYDEAEHLALLVASFHRYAELHGANYLDLVTALPIILAVENAKMNGRLVVRYVAPAAIVGVGLFVFSTDNA